MAPETPPAGKSLFARLFWVPPAVLIGVELYASRFEGWGAWATGPLFLVPMVLSLFLSVIGLIETLTELRANRLPFATLLYTLVAALPLLWLMIRRYVV